MAKCNICDREFDSDRGLSIHKTRVHGDDQSGEEKVVERNFPTTTIFKLAGVLIVFVLISYSLYGSFDEPTKDEVVGNTMDYINTNIKHGENTTLISSSEMNSTLYRMKINASGAEINVYVTKNGKYIFFNEPTEIG